MRSNANHFLGLRTKISSLSSAYIASHPLMLQSCCLHSWANYHLPPPLSSRHHRARFFVASWLKSTHCVRPSVVFAARLPARTIQQSRLARDKRSPPRRQLGSLHPTFHAGRASNLSSSTDSLVSYDKPGTTCRRQYYMSYLCSSYLAKNLLAHCKQFKYMTAAFDNFANRSSS